MGESTNPRATLRFDRRIRLEFHGATITSDAGLLACRELDDALGLTETANECLQESRGGRNVQHKLVGLLRQSVYSRLAAYEDTNDAERLADDPTMRVIVGRRGGPERPAASTNTMSRFETEVLTQDGNVEGLDRLNAAWVDRAMRHTAHRRVILDMDSSESQVHGEQEGASYNGHFGSMCYHPLFVFNQFGDCEGAILRAGNVHSAHRWRDVLDPILSRYGETGRRRYFRADAAFAKPDIYDYLEERRVFYAIRLPSNKVLQWEIAPLLIRPVGRPPKRPVILYDDFWYRAESWDRARRVVAKVEWHRGELFPRVGFIVTNMTAGPEGVVRFYNGRGTAEQWIKEGKYALNWTRLSCHRFVANRVRLSLFILAYNLGNFLRRLCLPKAVKHWSLRSVQGQADQDGRPSGAARAAVGLSVVRGVGSSTVVPGSAGSYRPVIAGAKLREGTTTILPRGGERFRESPCLQCGFTTLAGTRRRQKRTRSMVHGKNRIPNRIDRRLTGLAGPDYDATISFGLPFESEDSRYGKYRLDAVLCFKYMRTVAGDNTVGFNGATMQLLPDEHRASYARATVEVQERLDGSIVVAYRGRSLAAEPAPPGPIESRARSGRRANGLSPAVVAGSGTNGGHSHPVGAERRDGAKSLQGVEPLPITKTKAGPPRRPPNHPWRRRLLT